MHPSSAPGVSLASERTGSSPAQIVLLHGWMTSGGVFDPLVSRLQDRATCHVPDLRGCGSSPEASTYDLPGFLTDIVRWLDQQKLAGFTLIGHSMGGQLAQLLAATQPDRVARLILLNPVPASGLPLPDEARALFSASAADRHRLGIILDMATTTLPATERERLIDLAMGVRPACIRLALDAWTAGGFADQLDQIRCPTHVVATSDPFLPVDFLQQAVVHPIRGAALHHLEGPGHYPVSEAPDATAALLGKLLAG